MTYNKDCFAFAAEGEESGCRVLKEQNCEGCKFYKTMTEYLNGELMIKPTAPKRTKSKWIFKLQ